jgi:orotate phosphoribosyltransferase
MNMKNHDWIKIVSESFDRLFRLDMENVVQNTRSVHENVHVRYPDMPEGAHLPRFFNIEEAVKHESFIPYVGSDPNFWMTKENIRFDIFFAPNQPAVRKIVESLAGQRNKRAAFWEYLPTGRFGDKLVSGEIKPGDRVLVYNAVSIQGRCIGERLPSFVEALGGEVVAIACFAKGTTPKVRELEEKWGNKFYSAIQIDIPVYKPEDCPMCKAGEKLIPWTEL